MPESNVVDETNREREREMRWDRKLSVMLARERYAGRRGQRCLRRRIRRRRMRTAVRRQAWTRIETTKATILFTAALVLLTSAIGLILNRWKFWSDSLMVDVPWAPYAVRLTHGWVSAIGFAGFVIVWQLLQLSGTIGPGPIGRSAESALTNLLRLSQKATLTTLGSLTNRARHWLFPKLEEWGLLRSIVAMLAIASTVVAVAYWQLSSRIQYSPDRTSGGDLVRASLTVAGLIGGTVALVVAYRRQRAKEASQFVERFGEAAKQLGDEDPAVRLAGVYAMASAADESSVSGFRQQCVDVLCGYLRMPHEIDKARAGLVERSRKYTPKDDEDFESTDTFRFRYNDDEVRRSIVRVLAEHLQPDASVSWSDCRIDLVGATLVSANFSNCTFNERALFSEAVFVGETFFNGTQFRKNAVFVAAKFLGTTNFTHRELDGTNPTVFHQSAAFEGSVFESFVAFVGTQFHGPVTFSRRLRPGAAPNVPKRQTRFMGGLYWKNVQFADRVEFESAIVDRNFHCITTTFESTMSFSDSRVAGFYMDGTQFKAETTFLGCAFTGTTRFEKVNFEVGANLSGSTFAGETEFGPWNYSRPIYFTGCTFESRTSFHAASNWDRLRMPWSHIPEALSMLMGSPMQPDLVFPAPWPGPRLAAP